MTSWLMPSNYLLIKDSVMLTVMSNNTIRCFFFFFMIYVYVRLIFLHRSGCGGLTASTAIWCSRRLQSFQAGWSDIWITHFNKNKDSCLTFGGVRGVGGEGVHLGCCLWKETGGAARAGEPILLINICHCSFKVNELMYKKLVVPHWSLLLSQAPSVTVRFLWSGC